MCLGCGFMLLCLYASPQFADISLRDQTRESDYEHFVNGVPNIAEVVPRQFADNSGAAILSA